VRFIAADENISANCNVGYQEINQHGESLFSGVIMKN
jgi:hypothetical protein